VQPAPGIYIGGVWPVARLRSLVAHASAGFA